MASSPRVLILHRSMMALARLTSLRTAIRSEGVWEAIIWPVTEFGYGTAHASGLVVVGVLVGGPLPVIAIGFHTHIGTPAPNALVVVPADALAPEVAVATSKSAV